MESIIIAIVLGLIGTVFNKMNKSDEDKQPKKPTPTPTRIPDQRSIGKFEREKVEEKSFTENETVLNSHYEKTKQQVEETILQLAKEEKQLERQIHLQKQKVNTFKEKRHPLMANEDELVKGIILSEILGPPRAKKKQIRD
ncbi:uncharacterized membrane protein YraQ (UPF0718 family) [Oikeobacillus pervagus]|uniref:Uncharacterized membrane protein YraQ (UPF0718 family) n=1 Tax=Oikeobacillus pervagus TaxID=1325931 RepID=A0AAJ1SZ50_9BACI|nr:hypothetical protein [Oikeobacillus pervagus]MDQ0213922.1 uncharacterized membrane protein YraQ (UPF0718 family) [Oikeobacillus pervagus]